MADNITDKLKENAQGPAQMTGDQGSVRQHSLREQIEVDQYLRNTGTNSKKTLPLRFAKIRSGGAA